MKVPKEISRTHQERTVIPFSSSMYQLHRCIGTSFRATLLLLRKWQKEQVFGKQMMMCLWVDFHQWSFVYRRGLCPHFVVSSVAYSRCCFHYHQCLSRSSSMVSTKLFWIKPLSVPRRIVLHVQRMQLSHKIFIALYRWNQRIHYHTITGHTCIHHENEPCPQTELLCRTCNQNQ